MRLPVIVIGIIVAIAYYFSGHEHTTQRFDLNPQFRGLTKGEYFKASNGLWLYKRKWEVENPRALMVCLHGLAHHSAHFSEMAEEIKGLNISMYSFDFVGHGHSEGDPLHVENSQEHITNAVKFIKDLKARATLPVFLYGHSMGGLIATHVASGYPELVDGLLLGSPALIDSIEMPFRESLEVISGFLNMIVPRLPIIKLNSAELVADQSQMERITSDSLKKTDKIPLSTCQMMLDLRLDLDDVLKQLTTPFIIFQGALDKIVPPSVIEVAMKASSPIKFGKLLGNSKHRMDIDYDREEFFGAMREFLHGRLS
eukprot:TRINITY_DN9991_c0_g1_i1.p1 TRINITY_DN9991_c0_g1~~TRINITY_DN9991_c0_g1_i1.p1  ORF type:complete len:313 (-),score=52.44 TRINITY_DN9991_c0_g1_i1:50-988(-)